MNWLLIIGAIIYYLYRAYQQEAQKNVNKPLPPVNKPIRPAQKQVTSSSTSKNRPLDEVLRELREAGKQGEKKPEVRKIETVQEPEKKITSIEYDTMFGREENPLTSIEYQDSLFKTGESMDKITDEEGGGRKMSEMTAVNVDYEDKVIGKKYFVINGKMLSPKDIFIASMLWEKKV